MLFNFWTGKIKTTRQIPILLLAVYINILLPGLSNAAPNLILDQPDIFSIGIEPFWIQRDIRSTDTSGDFTTTAKLAGYRIRLGLNPAKGFSAYGTVGLVDMDIVGFDSFSSTGDTELGIGFVSLIPNNLHIGKAGNLDSRLFVSGNLSRFEAEQVHITTAGSQKEQLEWAAYNLAVGLDYRYKKIIPFAHFGINGVTGRDKLSISKDRDFEHTGLFEAGFGIRAALERKLSFSFNYSTMLNNALSDSELGLTINISF